MSGEGDTLLLRSLVEDVRELRKQNQAISRDLSLVKTDVAELRTRGKVENEASDEHDADERDRRARSTNIATAVIAGTISMLVAFGHDIVTGISRAAK